LYDWYEVCCVVTLSMLVILCVLYIFSYCRARNGSKLADVKLISIMLMVSALAAMVVIGCQYAMTRFPQDYETFSVKFNDFLQTYFDFVSQLSC
jgi:uncharacterized membrane protein